MIVILLGWALIMPAEAVCFIERKIARMKHRRNSLNPDISIEFENAFL